MPIIRHYYDVELSGGPEGPGREARVRVIVGDQLRAEMEMSRRGLRPQDAPFHLTAAWLWAACLRHGLIPEDTKFPAFADGILLEFQEVPDAQETADPTSGPGVSP